MCSRIVGTTFQKVLVSVAHSSGRAGVFIPSTHVNDRASWSISASTTTTVMIVATTTTMLMVTMVTVMLTMRVSFMCPRPPTADDLSKVILFYERLLLLVLCVDEQSVHAPAMITSRRTQEATVFSCRSCLHSGKLCQIHCNHCRGANSMPPPVRL